MSEKCLSSIHIQKIGHKIQEIRERALQNIISKLDSGYTFDNDLARSKELLQLLFNWFSFPECSCENIVLNLIKQILETESGKTLMKYYGNEKIIKELNQVQINITPRYSTLVNDILKGVVEHCQKQDLIVPPLECDVPLSYRSEDHYLLINKGNSAGTTATTIEGVVQAGSSNEQQTGVEYSQEKVTQLSFGNDNKLTSDINQYLPYYSFFWFALINTDQHVLESVENSLQNPSEASALLHTCEFFSNVMLHDFPSEVFLQRPTILLELQKIILCCPSSRIKAIIFNALLKFTRLLNVRMNYHTDPCTHNLKHFSISFPDSAASSPIDTTNYSNRTSPNSLVSPEIEKPTTTIFLKTKELSLTNYCLTSVTLILDYLHIIPSNIEQPTYRKKWRVCNVRALLLLNNLVDLIEVCLNKSIWDCRDNAVLEDVMKLLREVFIKFGDTIEKIRLYTISSDFELNSRFIHINLLNAALKFVSFTVPADKIDLILPRNLKNVLTNSLLDPAISRLYPGMHEKILQVVQEFSGRYENDIFTKYQDVKLVCKSMSAAIEFLKNHKSIPFNHVILLVKESLKSLDFHKDQSLIKIFIELCASKLSIHAEEPSIREDVSRIMLDILGHEDMDIRRETYRLCTKQVVRAIGPKLNASKTGAPGSIILFLLQSSILIEVTLYDLSSDDPTIQKLSEDILLHILKCKILVPDEIWNLIIEALIPTIPALLCYVDQTSPIGRTMIHFLDPDKAHSMNLTILEIFRGNCCLLFNEDASVRDEAISRLCWLLASQGDNKDLLPRINNLFDKTLSMCCQIKHVYDLNRVQSTQQYYQASSLLQVLELLNSNGVEPVIRRSALTQISVMMEDPMMHNTFIQRNGVETIIDIMKCALDDSEYKDYPDSVIPAVSILKCLCMYNATIRQQLSIKIDIYYLLVRGLFLFCTEERMKHEGSTLLFLLLYNNFIKGSPLKFDLALPEIIINKLRVPFACKSYMRKIQNAHNNLTEVLLQDKYCLQSLQIHWNSEWCGGFNELLGENEINYTSMENFNAMLRLSKNDLLQINSTSMEYCMNKCLKNVQNSTNHQEAVESLIRLTGYINMYKSVCYDFIFESNILNLPWKEVFTRFLNAMPSGEEDYELLQYLLELLIAIVPLYKEEGGDCWISNLLKNDTNPLTVILSKEANQDTEAKTVNKGLLTLITTCVSLEQHYLDFYGLKTNNSLSWSHIIEYIASNLKFSDSQHFYNLAYLDSLLSCLVHLTATLGWTKTLSNTNSRCLLVQIVTGLCEMIGAFHCGKGASAANSVMGLSITRHAVLILNHLLVEMQEANIHDWESCFIDEESGIEDNYVNLTSLWYSRDVVLRAGIFQLFAGLAVSHKCAINIVQEYRCKRKSNLWQVALQILLDYEESSIVRENVADMLTNLASHTVTTVEGGFTLDAAVAPGLKGTCTISELLKLLSDHNFYKDLGLMINCLYIQNKFYINEDAINKIIYDQNSSNNQSFLYTFAKGIGYTKQSTTSSSSDNIIFVITTPGLLKSSLMFLCNLMNLAPAEITAELQNHGTTRILFKSLFIPDKHIRNTKDLALYCDILEMNRAVCALLCRAVYYSDSCFSTIMNTRDCLNILFSLLNVEVYNSEFSQLVYLRNKLWTEIFNLLTSLLTRNETNNENLKIKNQDVLQIVTSVFWENGNHSFLQALCEAISSYNSTDLQNSALTSLTSLLKTEIITKENNTRPGSIQDLLDSTRTPRTTISKQDDEENLETFSPNSNITKISPKTSTSIQAQRNLHQLYLDSLNRIPKSTTSFRNSETASKETNFVIAGAELCRILLYMLEVANIKTPKLNSNLKKKSLILGSLTNILCVSLEAKKYALDNKLLDIVIKQIREFHVKLSLESVESLRRVSEKKRINVVLQEIEVLVELLTNFMAGDIDVKNAVTALRLADLIHKLWIWILHVKNLLVNVLKMLCTYTTNCSAGCQSLTLTSPVAGSGPRKVPSNVSLLHAIITLISKEMEQVSKTRDLTALELCFHLLHNSCISIECRIILSKSNLLLAMTRLHPAITKRQKPWETVELIWLEFLHTFSSHTEGQHSIAKLSDVLDLIIILTNSSKLANRETAMTVLRNISFNSSNRPRLLTSGDFLNVLNSKLVSGNLNEKMMVVAIVWALAANNQKAKLMLKCAGLETKLQEALKELNLSVEHEVDSQKLDQMYYVWNMLREGDK